jgi:poly(A) polymerase
MEMSDFFGSLQATLRGRKEVSSLVAVEGAYVPVMKLVFLGVDIDLLFARLSTPQVPRLLPLEDDNMVVSMEEKSVLALNGARVIECMLRLVPQVKASKHVVFVINGVL